MTEIKNILLIILLLISFSGPVVAQWEASFETEVVDTVYVDFIEENMPEWNTGLEFPGYGAYGEYQKGGVSVDETFLLEQLAIEDFPACRFGWQMKPDDPVVYPVSGNWFFMRAFVRNVKSYTVLSDQ